MNVQEYKNRKVAAEAVQQPVYWPRVKNIEGMAIFLKRYAKHPYPFSWYHEDVERTLAIYKREYAAYEKEYMNAYDEWETAQTELRTLEYLREKGLVSDEFDITEENYLYPY